MRRDLILGTAGHIDHGKTALVRALTGIDCDRLPQEKLRGITIDIGFAHLEIGEFRFGIVDVPGHERFVRNMLAGAVGVDLALLVISAIESVREQTREHLEILRLLDLRHGLIVLTKCDLVDDDTAGLAELEVRDLVADTFLADAPVVRTSAITGAGIEGLREQLLGLAGRITEEEYQLPFRLAIDRAFVLQGHGTVVTGTVGSGRLRAGDEIEWLPTGERVRVRSVQNHGQPVEEIRRGQRAALNLAGVELHRIERGQELATPSYLVPSKVMTIQLHAVSSAEHPLKHRLPIRFHLGTAEHLGTLSLLDCDTIEPGGTALAQVFLHEPALAVWGQPFVIRDSAAERTLGGGRVLQPVARKIRRRHLDHLERIEMLMDDDPERRLDAALWLAEFRGLDPTSLGRTVGVYVEPTRGSTTIGSLTSATGTVRLHAERVAELEQRLLTELDRLHHENPLMATHDVHKLMSRFGYLKDDKLVESMVERLILSGTIVGTHSRVARAGFTPKLSQNQRKLKQRILETFAESGLQPPEPGEFARYAGGNAASLTDLFEVCVAEGALIRVNDEMYLSIEAERELRDRLRDRLADGSGLTVAELRDLLGVTRKHAIPFCEYLDRIGFTRRDGDMRYLATDRAT